ncbi:hypothetical protein [Leuconostoc mesenteroides]|uniref:hypothetical protein n=1 Tax=Leuconostoc mesenteroides TaxID=1245 RepID=UPI0023609CFF|nr:hypothetical protein [Leuconostoc mesenteroides]
MAVEKLNKGNRKGAKMIQAYETTVYRNSDDAIIHIDTSVSNEKYRLRKYAKDFDLKLTHDELDTGGYTGLEVDASKFSVRFDKDGYIKVSKRRELSDEERAVLAERAKSNLGK